MSCLQNLQYPVFIKWMVVTNIRMAQKTEGSKSYYRQVNLSPKNNLIKSFTCSWETKIQLWDM